MLTVFNALVPGRFRERLNRFVALIDSPVGVVRAHLPTSSRMGELLVPEARVLLADHRARQSRATGFSLVMAYAGETLVSVDSGVPNRLLDVLLRDGALPEFAGWTYVRREARLGASRLDFLLENGRQRCWVEAKSVTLVRDGTAFFPDAPTARGARHLRELVEACHAGDRGAAVFVIQREDAERFAPNRELDPAFAEALDEALRHGVDVHAYACRVTPSSIAIARRVPVTA